MSKSFFVSYRGPAAGGRVATGSMDVVGPGIFSFDDVNAVAAMIQYEKDLPQPPTILFWRAYDEPAALAPTADRQGETHG